MPLDILRKDVIDDATVKSVTESPADASRDKSVVDLFEVPLTNYVPKSSSPKENFHGINVSVEKYATMSEALTNFIVEIREAEKKNDLNSFMPDKFEIDDAFMTGKDRELPINRNLEIDPHDVSANDKENDILFLNQEIDAKLKQDNCIVDVSTNFKGAAISKDKKEIAEYLLDTPFSPMQNSHSNLVLESTPRFIRDAPRVKIHNNADPQSIALFFEKSGLKLSPTNKISADVNMNQLSMLNESSGKQEHITDKSMENICDKDKFLQSEPDNKNFKLTGDFDDQREKSKLQNVHKFISPKFTPVKPNLNRQSHSKRELFSPEHNPFNTNNNKDRLKAPVNNILIKPLKSDLVFNQFKSKNLSASVDNVDKDVEQLINIYYKNHPRSVDIDMDKKMKTLHDSNMSIEEESLTNSFLNMSVDDNEPKKFELCRSTKKTNLDTIKEIKVIDEVVSEEIKSYKLPFVSSNPEENKDNNNNDWNYLKSLETDEERYRVVRSVWKNMHIPDPNVNLSCFIFYHKSKKYLYNGTEVIFNRKRQREGSDDQSPKAKRCKLFNNVNFFKKTLNETKRIVERNFQIDQKWLRRRPFGNLNKLRGRFYEKINQLESARMEVEAIHSFYKGLANQTKHDQQNVEREQTNVNKLYEKFRTIYSWSGRAFSHAVK